jgi:SEC-C motif/Tetratricopeptide repeat
MKRDGSAAANSSAPVSNVIGGKHTAELAAVKQSLRLICGVCEKQASYRVGTVVVSRDYLDAITSSGEMPTDDAGSSAEAVLDEFVGFTHYFRCKHCDAAGPWRLPPESRVRVYGKLILLSITGESDQLLIAEQCLWDRTPIRSPAQGEEIFRQRIAADPSNARLWLRLGNLLRNSGRPDLAIPALERATEIEPHNVNAHAVLADIFRERHATRKALAHWKAVLAGARYDTATPRDERLEMISVALDQAMALVDDPNELFAILTDAASPTSECEKECSVVHVTNFDLSLDSDWRRICRAFLGEPLLSRAEIRRREELAGLPPDVRTFPSIPRSMRTSALTLSESTEHPSQPVVHEPAASVRIGRNTACPCGSGRKFKRCCGGAGSRIANG